MNYSDPQNRQNPQEGKPPSGVYPPPGTPPYGQPYGITPQSGTFADLQAEFRSVPIETIIPFGAWFREKPWNVVWAKWFMVYALFPFALPVLLTVFEDPQIQIATLVEHIGWAYASFFAVLWLMVIYLCMKPGRMEYRLLASVAAFTALAGIPLVLLLQNIPPFSLLYATTDTKNLAFNLVGFVFGVGLLEECCKALPVYIMVFRTRREYAPLMYAFVGAVSGLAFGVVEAGRYTVKITGQIHSISNIPLFLITIFLRLITLPLLHACWSAISCYFMGLAFLRQRSSRALILIGLGIPVLLHGLYDTLADENQLIGIAIALFSLLVFVSYVQTGNMISRRLMDPRHAPYPGSVTMPPTQTPPGTPPGAPPSNRTNYDL